MCEDNAINKNGIMISKGNIKLRKIKREIVRGLLKFKNSQDRKT